ncbi:unnamed protein product [Linum tenue]|uniref:Uncharacterized protein n=1 Tax=Linum tenue TaxID=586396 RepID=A0AAV0KNT6_9ROSI|nr:unnamed protein product [Linum tenue]
MRSGPAWRMTSAVTSGPRCPTWRASGTSARRSSTVAGSTSSAGTVRRCRGGSSEGPRCSIPAPRGGGARCRMASWRRRRVPGVAPLMTETAFCTCAGGVRWWREGVTRGGSLRSCRMTWAIPSTWRPGVRGGRCWWWGRRDTGSRVRCTCWT